MLVLLLMRPAMALDWHSHSASLSGPGWHASNIDLHLAVTGGHPALTLRVGLLRLPGELPPVSDVQLACPDLTVSSGGWHCRRLMLQAARLAGQPLHGQGTFEFKPPAGVTLELPRLDWGASSFRLTAARNRQGWQVTLRTPGLALARLQQWLGPASGTIDGRVELAGKGARLQRASADLTGRAVTINAAGGRYASDHLVTTMSGHWRSGGAFSGDVRLTDGQLYLDPLYWQLKAGARPLTLQFQGTGDSNVLRLSPIALNDPGVVQARGSLTWRLRGTPALARARIDLKRAWLPAFYRSYLQPWLGSTALAGLTTVGQLSGRLALHDGVPESLDLQLRDLGLQAADKRFGISGLDGRLVLNPAPAPSDSSLGWRQAHFYRIRLGSGRLDFSSQRDQLELRRTSSVAVLDGRLLLQQLALGGLGSKPWLRFGGQIQDLSMTALSKALGWPPLAGTLTGVIPEVRYHDQVVDVDGALLIHVFGGNITVGNLSLRQPFGPQPRLGADLELYQLDLQQLTKTFDFGRIEGKLSGFMHDLELVDWKPVAFDAYLHTPPGDNSRHRISQRAVQALSSLGGSSAAGVLSRGFLSLFKDFNYARLGIRCRLQAGVCIMGGVAPGPQHNNYYLVQGRSLPRLDVIGYNREVDWAELLARLAAAINSQGPVIK